MKNKMNGVIWITGYSGVGKTTIGSIVYQNLLNLNYKVVHLDGDELRSIFNNQYGYSFEDRKKLANVYSNLCRKLSSSGIVVVISVIAMFKTTQEYNRKVIDNYFEVFLDVPFEVLRERDQKGIYLNINKSSEIFSQYDIPSNPNLRIDNSGSESALSISNRIVSNFINFLEKDLRMSSSFINVLDSNTSRSDTDVDYWDVYYQKLSAPINSSSFAIYCDERFFVPNSKILEFGCGNGRDSFYFARKHKVTAIDPSSAVIDLNISKNHTLAVNFICSKFNNSLKTLNDNSFDIVYSRFVMHAMNLEDENQALSFAYYSLKKNGLLCLEFRTDNDPLMDSGFVLSKAERITDHYRRFINFEDFKSKLINAGFEIIYEVEKNNLAVYKKDNPVVGRVVAKKI